MWTLEVNKWLSSGIDLIQLSMPSRGRLYRALTVEHSVPHMAFECTLRRGPPVAHGAPIIDVGGQQIAVECTLGRKSAITHGAPIMSFRGQLVAVECTLEREPTITHGAPIVGGTLRREPTTAHGAPVVSFRGQQVAVDAFAEYVVVALFKLQ